MTENIFDEENLQKISSLYHEIGCEVLSDTFISVMLGLKKKTGKEFLVLDTFLNVVENYHTPDKQKLMQDNIEAYLLLCSSSQKDRDAIFTLCLTLVHAAIMGTLSKLSTQGKIK